MIYCRSHPFRKIIAIPDTAVNGNGQSFLGHPSFAQFTDIFNVFLFISRKLCSSVHKGSQLRHKSDFRKQLPGCLHGLFHRIRQSHSRLAAAVHANVHNMYKYRRRNIPQGMAVGNRRQPGSQQVNFLPGKGLIRLAVNGRRSCPHNASAALAHVDGFFHIPHAAGGKRAQASIPRRPAHI